jgi:hypothetical protein
MAVSAIGEKAPPASRGLLRAQRHHAAKLQEVWQAVGSEGFPFFLIESRSMVSEPADERVS